MNPTILVTGGAGYIGSHACKALARAGYTPVTYDNLSRGHKELVKWGPLEIGDILDRDRLTTALVTHKPTAVMHFAAFAYVGESVAQPEMYYRNNVVGTLTLLECMRKTGVTAIVFSSSCATYGNPIRLPIDEDHPQNPVNPYGMTKLTCERMIMDSARTHDLRYAILRYFNAAGADPDGETGEWHDPETHLIPLAIGAALGSGAPLRVFGGDYSTKDRTCIRDYVHVSDLATAHVLALASLMKGKSEIVCNLGTGIGCSTHEMIAAIEQRSGRKVPHAVVARRPGDPAELVADARRASDVLGWVPGHSALDSIVGSALGWGMNRRSN